MNGDAMSESLPKPIRVFKDTVEAVVHTASSWVDTCAERVVRDGLGWVPEGEAQTAPAHRPNPTTAGHIMKDGRVTPPGRQTVPTSVPVSGAASKFADTEEIGWLESAGASSPTAATASRLCPRCGGRWRSAASELPPTQYPARRVILQEWPSVGHSRPVARVSCLADLGRPERFPRVFVRPDTSWIARGSWAFGAFAAGGAVSLLPFLPQPVRTGATALANTGAVVLAVYDGLFLNHAKAVQSPLPREVPALFAANAVQAGAALSGAPPPPCRAGCAASA